MLLLIDVSELLIIKSTDSVPRLVTPVEQCHWHPGGHGGSHWYGAGFRVSPPAGPS